MFAMSYAPGTPPYVELHAPSAYSFLDGASMPDELAEQALLLGHRALALTDHDSLSGAMELAVSAQETKGLRPIFGAEVTVKMAGRSGPSGAAGDRSGSSRGALGAEDPRHLTLLVQDRRGWANLCRLISLAHSHTRDGPGRRGRDKAGSSAASGGGQPSVTLAQVIDHAEGLVCLRGCAARGIHEPEPLRKLLDAFGPGSLRVELQRPYSRHDHARTRMLARRRPGA